MKKLFTLLVLSVILFACSSDDEEVVPTLNVNTETLNFTFDREERSLIIDTNTGWTAETDAEWLSLSSASGTGPATIEILSAYNGTDKNRSAKITIKGDNIVVYVTINQNKLPETSGLYILSEGNWNMNQAELAYYDIESDNIQKKYFFTQNNTNLGDTGNDLAIYGSKMYCVVSGANLDHGGYIEIITPPTGK